MYLHMTLLVFLHVAEALYRDGYNYTVVNAKKTWENSKNYCKSLGMELATPESVEEDNWIKSLSNAAELWLGFHDMNTEGVFQGTDGTVMSFSGMCSGEPSGGNSENCVAFFRSPGCWVDVDCGTTRSFVCESFQPVTEALFRDGFDYKFVYGKKTWEKSKNYCNSIGMDLARPESEEESDWLLSVANDTMIWLGIHDQTTENVFQGTDGTAIAFNAMSGIEPNGGNSENCVAMHVDLGYWVDANCITPSSFLCKSFKRASCLEDPLSAISSAVFANEQDSSTVTPESCLSKCSAIGYGEGFNGMWETNCLCFPPGKGINLKKCLEQTTRWRNFTVEKTPPRVTKISVILPEIVELGEPLKVSILTTGKTYSMEYKTEMYDVSGNKQVVNSKESQLEIIPTKIGRHSLFTSVTGYDSSAIFRGTATASSGFDVHAYVNSVDLECPNFVGLHVAFHCKVCIVGGTSVELKFDWGEDQNHTIPLIDTSVYHVGDVTSNSTVEDHLKYSTAVPVTVLMPNRMFSHNGTIAAITSITFDAVTATVQIYRPLCQEGFAFCYKAMACLPSSLLCKKQADFFRRNCTGDFKFSLFQQECVHSVSGVVKEVTPFENLPLPHYQLVEEQQMYLPKDKVGKVQVYKFVNPIKVKKGDIPAIRYNNSAEMNIAFKVSQSGSEVYFSNISLGNRVLNTSAGNPRQVSTYVKFIVARPTCILMPQYRYSNSSGFYDATAVVTSKALVATRNVSRTIHVQEIVSGLDFIVNEIGCTGIDHQVHLKAHNGTFHNYVIYWGDGSNSTYNESVTTLTHMYTLPGIMTLEVIAANNVSSQTVKRNITIEDRVEGLDVSFKSYPAIELGKQMSLSVCISSGTNTKAFIDLGDGQNRSMALSTHGGRSPVEHMRTHTLNHALVAHSLRTYGNQTVESCFKECLLEEKCFGISMDDNNTCSLESGSALTNPRFLRTFSGKMYSPKPDADDVMPKSKLSIVTSSGHSFLEEVSYNFSQPPVFHLSSSLNTSLKAQFPTSSFIYKIIMQGDGVSSWLTRFRLWWSIDNLSWDFKDFKITSNDTSNRTTIVIQQDAKFVIMVPLGFHESPSFRLEVYAAPSCLYSSHIVNYTFEKPGDYNVTVTIGNQWNEMKGNVLVPVQVPLTNCSLHQMSTLAFGESRNIYIRFSQGAGFKFKAFFNELEIEVSHVTDLEWAAVISPDMYKVIGLHNVSVRADNLVSNPIECFGELWVDYALTNVSFTSSHSVISSFENMEFTLQMARGSRFACDIYYGDSSDVIARHLLLAQDAIIFNHSFPYDGVFDVSLNCSNDVSNVTKQVTVIAQNIIKDIALVMDKCVEIPFQQPGDVSFILEYRGNDTHIPTNVTFTINDGRNFSSSQRVQFNTSSPVVFRNNYTQYGTYNTTVESGNLVSNKTLEAIMDVDRLITNLSVHPITHVINVSEKVDLVAEVVWGTRIWFSWNFLDGNNVSVFKLNETSSRMQHQYLVPGHYRVNVSASNCAGSSSVALSQSEKVIVEYPVEKFELRCNSESLLPYPERSIDLEFDLLVGNSVSLPTDAFLIVDFDDGTSAEKVVVLNCSGIPFGSDVDLCLHLRHNYTQPGTFNVSVRLWNLVSSTQLHCQHTVYTEITGLQTFYIDELEENPGYGPQVSVYPSHEPIKMISNRTSGTQVSCWWDFGDGSVRTTPSQVYIQSHIYQAPGEYQVHLNCSNPLHALNFSRHITIQDKVVVNVADCGGTSERGALKTFLVSFSQVGTCSCYFIDFADEKTTNGRFLMFGNTTQCIKDYNKTLSNLIGNMTDRSDGEIYKEKTLLLVNQFESIGRFEFRINISNVVSSVSSSCTFGITRGPCSFPKVDVKTPNSCQQSNCDSHLPGVQVVFRSHSFFIYSLVELSCWKLTTSYHWSVYEEASDGSWRDISDFLVQNKSMVLQSGNLRKLKFKSHTLDYGLYKFVLNVTMLEEVGIWTVREVLFRIAKSPLHVDMVGGIYVGKKYLTNLTLDAYTTSYDPDIVDEDLRRADISYWFYCRRVCDRWSLSENLTKSPCNGTIQFPPGCLKNGLHTPGLLVLNGPLGEHDRIPFGNISMGQMWLDSSNMIEGEAYEILVEARKDDRVTWFTQKLNITHGDPPEVSIELVANKRQKLNPRQKLSARSHIKSFNRFDKYTYRWDIISKPKDFNLQYYEAFRWPEDNWLWSAEGTGITGSDLALDPFVFDEVELYGKEFYLYVSVLRGSNPEKGIGFRKIIVNEPPSTKDHKCTISPHEGIALNTTFAIECDGFQDEDRPFMFEFYQQLNKDFDKAFIQSNTQPQSSQPIRLPAGLESNNHNVFIIVRVIDSIGSFSDVEHTVKVVYDFNTLDDVKPYVIGSDSLLEKFQVQGDSESLVQLVSVIGDVCNYYLQASDNETIRQHTANTAIQILDICSEAIFGHNSVDDFYSMKSTASAGEKLSTPFEVISRKSQKKLHGLYDSLLEHLINEGANMEMDSGDLEMISTLLTSFTGNLINCARYSLTNKEETNATAIEIEVKELMAAIDTVSKTISDIKVIGETATTIESKSLSYSVAKNYAAALSNKTLSADEGGSQFILPQVTNGDIFNQGNSTAYYYESLVVFQPSNPFTFSAKSANITSGVISMEVHNDLGNVTKVKDLPDTQRIEVFIQQKNAKPLEPVCGITRPSQDHMIVHRTTLPPQSSFVILVAAGSCNDTGEETTLTSTVELSNSTILNVTGNATTDPMTNNATIFTMLPTTAAPQLGDVGNATSFQSNGKGNSTVVRGGHYNNSSMYSNSTTNSTQTNMSGSDDVIIFAIFIKAGEEGSETDYDYACLVNPLMSGDKNLTVTPKCFIDNVLLKLTEQKDFYFGLRAVNSSSLGKHWQNITLADLNGVQFVTVNYSVQVFSAACQYFDKVVNDWSTEGCQVGSRTSPQVTHCHCNHLTSFASSFYVPMNKIVPPAEAFSQLDTNPICFVFGISVMAIYFVVVIWARYADKKDLEKVGVTPLPDNNPLDEYSYEITLWTGFRTNCGTTAKVSFMLSGDEGETKPRLLRDQKRPILKRGAIDSFLVTVPQSLGKLSHLRVWHDNSGKSPSWFFSRMLVQDVQTGQKYYFICDQWLAVEEDDGLIDRIIPIAGRMELTSFNHLFWTKTRRNLSDGHLWFSVASRPPRSTFTRVQRVTCCLSLLFLTMTANILFYDTEQNVESPQSIKLGPIVFTLNSIYTGLISSLIVFPISLVVVTIFRMSDVRKSGKKQLRRDVPKSNKNQSVRSKKQESLSKRSGEKYEKDIRPYSRMSMAMLSMDKLQTQFDLQDETASRILRTPPPGTYTSNFTQGLKPAYSEPVWSSATDDGSSVPKKPKKKKKCLLPWWFIIFGYILCYGSVAGAFIIIVGVGAGFGPEKSGEWVASMITSLVESIFFTQPIKVLILALFYALVIKRPDSDEDEEAQPLTDHEEYLHVSATAGHDGRYVHRLLDRDSSEAIMPPDEELLKEARATRLKEIKMQAIVREIVFYILFMMLLSLCAYSNRDPWMYGMQENMNNVFVQGLHDNVPPGDKARLPFPMTKVTNFDNFWQWMELTVLPGLYQTTYYNGDTIQGQFTADKNGYLMGVARLRQLRIDSDSCIVPNVMSDIVNECRSGYDLVTEDTSLYGTGWLQVNSSGLSSNTTATGWQFQSAIRLDGYPFPGLLAYYGGGGYVAELGADLSASMDILRGLRNSSWLDLHTRAVFVEFVIYNGNLNLHGVSMILVEFSNGGGTTVYPHFHVMRLDRYVGSYMFFVMAIEIITGLTILYFTVLEIKKMKNMKREYFKESWNIVELIQVCLTMITFSLFIVRIVAAMRTSAKYRKNKEAFGNFQYAVLWDELYNYFLAFIIFVTTVKLLKLLRFNNKMSMLSLTLRTALGPISNYMIVFSIFLLAYAQLAYLCFSSLLFEFHSFITAVETLLVMLLNKFHLEGMLLSYPVLGRAFFVGYTVLMSFILINLMLSMINESFSSVKHDLSKQSNEYEIVDFIFGRFKQMIGFGGQKKVTLHKDRQHVYYDSGEQDTYQKCDEFKDKVDTLLDKLTDYFVFNRPGAAPSRGSQHTKNDLMLEQALHMRSGFKKKTLRL